MAEIPTTATVLPPEPPSPTVHEQAVAAVRQTIADTPTIKPHHQAALVMTTDGINAGLATKTDSGWDMDFNAGFDKQQGLNAGFTIRKSW